MTVTEMGIGYRHLQGGGSRGTDGVNASSSLASPCGPYQLDATPPSLSSWPSLVARGCSSRG